MDVLYVLLLQDCKQFPLLDDAVSLGIPIGSCWSKFRMLWLTSVLGKVHWCRVCNEVCFPWKFLSQCLPFTLRRLKVDLYHLPGITLQVETHTHTAELELSSRHDPHDRQVVFSIYFTAEVIIRYMSYQSTWKLDDECGEWDWETCGIPAMWRWGSPDLISIQDFLGWWISDHL